MSLRSLKDWENESEAAIKAEVLRRRKLHDLDTEAGDDYIMVLAYGKHANNPTRRTAYIAELKKDRGVYLKVSSDEGHLY